jgi:hypothetical protein
MSCSKPNSSNIPPITVRHGVGGGRGYSVATPSIPPKKINKEIKIQIVNCACKEGLRRDESKRIVNLPNLYSCLPVSASHTHTFAW